MSILGVKNKSFLRFGIVGCINTGVDFLVYTLLSFVGVDKLIAQAYAYTAGLLNSFMLNKNWTFKTKKTNTINEFLKFLPINMISLGFTLVGIWILCDVLTVNVFLAKGILTVFAQLINYFGYKVWVFEEKYWTMKQKRSIYHGKQT